MRRAHKKYLCEILEKAGISIDGDNPWDLQVHDEDLYSRILSGGRLAVGESYMDGWWSAKRLDGLICYAMDAHIEAKFKRNVKVMLFIFSAILFNRQSVRRAFEVGEQHYDAGNDLFEAMLDPLMMYSCGYWKEAKTLKQAQEDKAKLISEKLQLKSGMRVLDIGCGWGGMAEYMAKHYDVSVVGVTISKEQEQLGSKRVRGLPVDIRVQDYRLIGDEPFDRIVSIGMFEHVGYKNYRTYIEKAAALLKDDGLFLLHTIGGDTSVFTTDPWFDKYIFPNGMLPSIAQIGTAFEDVFVMEDWHNFGADYDKTLMSWYENFKNAWPGLRQSGKYTDRFYRMWEYYLLSSAGLFRARRAQLWQVVLSKGGVSGGYERPFL